MRDDPKRLVVFCGTDASPFLFDAVLLRMCYDRIAE